MCIKAEDNLGWTIADELKYHGDYVDGVFFDRIVICQPHGLTETIYTLENANLDLGVLLLEAFGDEFIKVIDVDAKRIFTLD